MKYLLLFCSFLVILGWSCHNSPNQPAEHTISLKASDVGVLDVTLDVHFNTTTSHEFRIERGNTVIANGTARTADTLIFIDGLEPAHAYTFRAFRYDSGFALDSTATLAIHTMDTTSHNITWQVEHFAGQGGSSQLYDVAIINDTCVYAVGNMFISDSNGSGDGPFALAKWNGRFWILSEIPQPWYSSSVIGELNSIIAFRPSDAWAVGDHTIMHWDGSAWSAAAYFLADQPYPNRVLHKIWGSNDTSLYAVGGAGEIFHQEGAGWKLLNTGTTLDFYDIYGVHDSTKDTDEVYAVAGDLFQNFDRAIFKIVGDSVYQIPTGGTGMYTTLVSLWFKSRSAFYTVGAGIYQVMPWQNWQWQTDSVTTNFSQEIRGPDRNDLFVVGDYADLLHFNGATWHNFRPLVSQNVGSYHAVAVKGNLVVAVGYSNDESAAVAIGRR